MWRALNFVAGLLLGAALGASLVLLTTPKSGADTRALVRSRIDGLLEEGRQAAAERRAELETRMADLKGGKA